MHFLVNDCALGTRMIISYLLFSILITLTRSLHKQGVIALFICIDCDFTPIGSPLCRSGTDKLGEWRCICHKGSPRYTAINSNNVVKRVVFCTNNSQNIINLEKKNQSKSDLSLTLKYERMQNTVFFAIQCKKASV